MRHYRTRLRNRILQALYRPRRFHRQFVPTGTLDVLEEIDKGIEEHITPLLSDFFSK